MKYLEKNAIEQFSDERGIFLPFYVNHHVADLNIVHNEKNVLRGMHSQIPEQTKTVICVKGNILDFVYYEEKCYVFNLRMGEFVTVPKGAYHGYITRVESTVAYLTDVPYNPDNQLQMNFFQFLEEAQRKKQFSEFFIREIFSIDFKMSQKDEKKI